MGASWRASGPRWPSLRGDVLPMITLFPSQGDFCATAKKRFVEEGFEAALYRNTVTNVRRRKMTGDEEAHLIALFCSQVPEGHERWTLRMLADKMVELEIVDSVSHETVRRTLKKTNLNPGKRKNGVFHQNKTLLLSAKWRKS